MKLVFGLNGQDTELETAPDRRVVDLLREDLGLTGVKDVCGTGSCGACTVLLDGVPRLSCLLLAAQVQGRSLTTIEGLAQEPRHRPLLHAFAEHGAVQCGYCTPGMVTVASALLDAEPAPDRERVRHALSGNLCRCTGYQMIVDAVLAAAGGARQEPDTEEET